MQYALLLVFTSDVEKERIERWIAALKEKGVLEDDVLKKFDPQFDMPVLYFP